MRASMEAWLPKELLAVLPYLILFSIVAFVGTLTAIPYILVNLPADYFDERRRREWFADHHPVLRAVFHGVKNAFGVVFLLAGFAMLFLPGQGILTMLIGVSLMDFPGKRRLERKLIGRPAILNTINALRKKFNKPPLIVTDAPSDARKAED